MSVKVVSAVVSTPVFIKINFGERSFEELVFILSIFVSLSGPIFVMLNWQKLKSNEGTRSELFSIKSIF